MKSNTTLADRLGVTVHCSPLEYKLKSLAADEGVPSDQLDEWLVDLANHRGATVVERRVGQAPEWPDVPDHALSFEELVVLICQPQRKDHPQILRLAAQLISRGVVDCKRLVLLAQAERAERVLKALTEQALRVDATHTAWNMLARDLREVKLPGDSILHWSRLAEPVPTNGVCDGKTWRLVA